MHVLSFDRWLCSRIIGHLNLIINLMSLIGKRVLILGGNGYLGNYFASRFVMEKATVMSLSR